MKKQREIKFRAWDKKRKRMGWLISYAEDMCTVLWDGDKEESGIGTDEIIVMQYTGLKDKKGVEIYESDILRFKELNPFVIEWQGDDNKDYNYGWNFGRKDGEVIGNIYEGVLPKYENTDIMKQWQEEKKDLNIPKKPKEKSD